LSIQAPTVLARFAPRAVASLVAVIVAVLLLVAASGVLVPAAAVVAVLVVALLAVAALRWPAPAMCLAIGAVAVVPIYWGRPTIGKSLVAVPVTVAAVVLLPAALERSRRLRLRVGLIDVCYGAFVGFLTLAALLNVRHGIGAAVGIAWRYLVPYAVFRLLALRWLDWRVILRVFAAAGTVLAGFGLYEHATNTNPFFTWVHPNYQADQWAHSTFRLDRIRVEASFGEPISFGLFLAVCAIASLTVAVVSKRQVEQAAAVAATVVMLVAIIDTQSRAALVAVVGGIGFQLIRLINTQRVRRVAVVVALAGASVVFTPLGSHLQSAFNSASGDTREAASAQYRLAVFDVLTDSSQYSLIGHPNDQATGVSDLGVRNSGLKSLDNEYAYALVTGGALALAALCALALALIGSAIASRERDPAARAFMSAAAVISVSLLSVALLTQFSDLFGIILALLAAQAQRRRDLPALPAADMQPAR
jgi:hypothetical protein